MKMKNYRRGKHSVTLLYAHLVFVTKYRREILSPTVRQRCSEVFREVGGKMGFRVLDVNGEQDHLHLLIE